jgi:two-component system, chemotaxis family, CheB/CheR fusion protein
LLREVLAAHNSDAPITIFGTDIDPNAIAFARSARFRKTDGLSAERLHRWFVNDGDHYSPVAAIRDVCIFSEHSLVKDPPFSKLDLVSCRNVLIYMDNDLQQRIMQIFHYALVPGGYLFLGPSESVSRASRLFEVANSKHRILQRQSDIKATLPDFHPSPPVRSDGRSLPAREDRVEKSARRIMTRHSPAYFVIDRQHNIQRFSGGETGRYLEPSQGSASFNLFAILAKTLRSQVRRAVESAFASGQPVIDENFSFGIGGRVHAVDLIVEPIAEDSTPADLVVVAFRERPHQAEAAGKPAPDRHAEALQQEVRVWQARHQAASDDLESQIENIKSMTEEFQSINEELQSSNEELETSKEEMQSVNEELQTINGELHGKNHQLTQVNNDLQNLLDSTQIATIFLDDELRVRNFTPAAMELFALREGDRGRPITDIVTMLSYDRLRDDVRKVQRTLTVIEHDLDLKDESATFIMRMRPYRTLANVISGVVITFNNITERKQQADHLQILMKELQHRTNNLFTVIQAMARQTARHSANFADFETQFAARIQGLSASNLLLIDQHWKGVLLETLVHTQLAPFIGVEEGRLATDGPAVVMTPETVQTLGMALHELATNAAKYGALSSSGGKILVNWRFDDDNSAPDTFWLEWREQGGPAVKPSKRKGFGHFVTDQMVTRGLDARIEADFAPDGLRWTIQMPAEHARGGRGYPDKSE